jgi:hypothetical protein
MDAISKLIRDSANNGLEALAARLDALEKAQLSSAEKLNALSVIFDHSLRASLRSMKATQALRTWTYDARMPNTVFTQLALPERDADGKWFRWVSDRNAVSGQLDDFPRSLQYDLVVDVAAFPNSEAEQTFYVAANGLELPWLEVDNRVYQTIIPTSQRDMLYLEIGVSPTACQSAGGNAFAFSKIELKAR